MADSMHTLYTYGTPAVLLSVLLLWWALRRYLPRYTVGGMLDKLHGAIVTEHRGSAITRYTRWPYPTPYREEIAPERARRAAESGCVSHYQRKITHDNLPR